MRCEIVIISDENSKARCSNEVFPSILSILKVSCRNKHLITHSTMIWKILQEKKIPYIENFILTACFEGSSLQKTRLD